MSLDFRASCKSGLFGVQSVCDTGHVGCEVASENAVLECTYTVISALSKLPEFAKEVGYQD